MRPPFWELAENIKKRWDEENQKLDSFSQIATSELESFNYTFTQSELDELLAQWLLSGRALPDQINVHNTFGQPPLTLFNDQKFVLDLYIWVNFDTSIHSHGFRGAFKVLHGSSLHEVFSVTEIEPVSKDVVITELGSPQLELLKAGDTRTIEAETGLTHRVIHLANPTYTLCAKTINEVKVSQWNYFLNGLAIQKRPATAALVKKIYFYQYLEHQGSRLAFTYLARLLDSLSLSEQMNLYEDIWAGTLDLDEIVRQKLVDAFIERHGDSNWFRLYEAANPELQGHLNFSLFDEPVMRLLGHFINSDFDLKDCFSLLNEASGTELSLAQVREACFAFAVETPQQASKIQRFLNSI